MSNDNDTQEAITTIYQTLADQGERIETLNETCESLLHICLALGNVITRAGIADAQTIERYRIQAIHNYDQYKAREQEGAR